MGMLNVLVLKCRGARVIVCELDPQRRAKAQELGADVVLDPSAGDVVATVRG
jgi:threonine dehydrogenase-like Zn-dependent dehydrogenase